MHIAEQRSDDVNGIIIGDYYTAWQVFYAGRAQSGKFYADTSEDAMAAARTLIDKLKAENCGPPCCLYDNAALWTVRLWSV